MTKEEMLERAKALAGEHRYSCDAMRVFSEPGLPCDCGQAERVEEILALLEMRVPCRGCKGEDTADGSYALCYSCRQKDHAENEEQLDRVNRRAEAERAKVRELEEHAKVVARDTDARWGFLLRRAKERARDEGRKAALEEGTELRKHVRFLMLGLRQIASARPEGVGKTGTRYHLNPDSVERVKDFVALWDRALAEKEGA